MLLYVAIVFLVSSAVHQANADDACRCFPEKMSGTLRDDHYRTYHFEVDYNRKLAVEIHSNGKTFYDFGADKKYVFTWGGCTESPLIGAERYVRCAPDDAVMHDEAGPNVVEYSYTLHGSNTVTVTMDKQTCLPKRFSNYNTFFGSFQIVEFLESEAVSHPDELDEDLSRCTQ